jgi:hypothetical protein
MEKVPKFKTAEEEAEFWETHSPLEFPDEFEEVKEPIVDRRGRKKGIYIRIDPEAIRVARSIGAELGIGYQTLFRMWIMQGLGRYLTHRGGETTITGPSSSLPETLSGMSPQRRRRLLEHLAGLEAMVQDPLTAYGRRAPSRSTPRRPASGGGEQVARVGGEAGE